MTRIKYTEKFEAFWKAYPRKTAKQPAFKAWVKQGIEDDAFLPNQALQDIEKRNRLLFWPKDHTKIPHAATWINQARWDDEGWEDEIKNREDGTRNAGEVKYTPPIDDGPDLSVWQIMCNRIARNYLLKAGGLTDERCKQLIRTKNELLAELVPAIEEEIAADDSKEKKVEMATMLGESLVQRLDIDLQLNLAARVLQLSRK